MRGCTADVIYLDDPAGMPADARHDATYVVRSRRGEVLLP